MRDKKFHKLVGEKLQDLRKNKSLFQQDVAAKVKAGVRTIKSIEAGTNNSTADLLIAICDCYDVKFSVLLKNIGY